MDALFTVTEPNFGDALVSTDFPNDAEDHSGALTA
jgi:hypothetical protein